MRGSRATQMNSPAIEKALADLRMAQKVEKARPVVQRYELERRIERLEGAAETLRIEWRRCWMQSAGIGAQIDELNAAGSSLKNHIAHLKMLRDALPQ